MRKKLIIGAISIASIVFIIIVGNQVIIKLFGKFSEKLITEYHELNALQEFKISLSRTMIFTNHSEHIVGDISGNELNASIEDARLKYKECSDVLTLVHKKEAWSVIEDKMEELERIYQLRNTDSFFDDALQKIKALTVLQDMIDEIESLVTETVLEIQEYEEMNRKVILHGTTTVMASGLILLLFLSISGTGFIRRITRPIQQLVDATQRIGKGDMATRVSVDSRDEFLLLAESFNSMLDDLKQSTISEEYHKNILNNLFGALIVTDVYCKIRSVNTTTINLLGFKENELLGKNVSILFDDTLNISDTEPHDCQSLESLANMLTKSIEVETLEGYKIPVYVTCTILRDSKGTLEGMVVVIHDLTEEKKNEARIERIRKEGVIAINEAQENERLRIATDIHDGLGQMLAGISYSLNDIDSDSDRTNSLKKLHKQVDTVIKEARSIAHNLTPILLKDFGMVAAIKDLVEKSSSLSDLEIIFNSYDFDERIDPKIEKALYRICQEGLNNILKHSKAKNASVELFLKEDFVVLVIDDDGVGFNNKKQGASGKLQGIGLISIRERVYAFDGILTVNSESGKGSELIIEIPLNTSN